MTSLAESERSMDDLGAGSNRGDLVLLRLGEVSGKLDALTNAMSEKRADLLLLGSRVGQCEAEIQTLKVHNGWIAGGVALFALLWPFLIPVIKHQLGTLPVPPHSSVQK